MTKSNYMKKKIRLLASLLTLMAFLIVLTFSCKKDEVTIGTITDIDGNVYKTIKIGSQWWMAENLKVTKYRDGSPIPNRTNKIEWASIKTGAYCNYDNTASKSTIYGKLYNWYAVNDSRKIAPTGWHVPTDEEWTILTIFLAGESIVGGKLKETGTTHWQSPNIGATNETGFTALPGGMRDGNSTFHNIGFNGSWWSSTEAFSDFAFSRGISCNRSNLDRDSCYEINGLSVRCIKDY